ncbi:SAM-dependent methyltransferase [Halocatena pleomorpha]|uniref:Methyltransferase domain-containing protein n=1 Tax=Halocatena pleomorpha TaxID=1785090 RepID=A0A3P3RKW3_9EURY|nr:methyltransferase domain-containing protein [Halocatena pleomorpha]RRJ34072.1 methyltransferase domain-containing protein [Halocatena pleomorpha]
MAYDVSSNSISDYYTKVQYIYDWTMDEFDHQSIHAGYYDNEHTSRDTAVKNMNRHLADAADIRSDDTVLHAGCGVGGPPTWVAKHCGSDVIGINITDLQLDRARELARERGVAEQCEFRYDDFTEMHTIRNNEIDVVWALQAVCHADEKREFLEQAKRVLTDGGRLVVADGFMAKRNLSGREQRHMNKWLHGWKVPNLAHINDFVAHLGDLGFENIRVRNDDDNVMPFAKGTYRNSLSYYPKAKLLRLLGRLSRDEASHFAACYYQYRTLKKGLWTHRTVTAEV